MKIEKPFVFGLICDFMALSPLLVNSKVETFTLEYKAMSDKNAIISITRWWNGDGYDIMINSGNLNISFSAGYEDMEALVALYSGMEIECKDDDEA